jgi:hypothetical protein
VTSIIASLVLLLIFLANIIFIFWSIFQLKKDWPVIFSAWKQMETFEKTLLSIGFSFFVCVPILKEHPASDWYLVKVMIEIFPAMAGGFFVAGVLAFMRQVHDIRKKDKGTNGVRLDCFLSSKA